MEIRRRGALPLRRPGASSNLQPQIRVNGRIRAREVRVIMGSTGEQLGVMRLNDALRRAQTLGLDLVEMAHQEFGMQLVEKVRDDLSGMSQVEMDPKITGRNITMTLAPLPANRRKRRFAPPLKTDDETEGIPSATDT